LALFDPAPLNFNSLNLDARLLSGIKDLGWSDTRPVQSGVIPLALTGADVIACAETGTGKTAAFLVPILQRFLNEPAPVPPRTRALVLAPTRELAVQIEDQVQGLTYHTTVSSIAVYGGVPMDQQERALKAHVDMVVATPGRLMDHMRHDTPSFLGLEVLVLDEADRMLDMGFWPDVQRILAALPATRQTLLFSATMPAEVLKLTQEFLREPKYVQVGRRGGPAQTITHAVQEVPSAEKTKWLAQWLREESEGPVLILCRTKIVPRRCTPIARSSNAWPQWRDSVPAPTPCWWPPTWPRAAWTSKALPTWSISKCPTRQRHMCTAWAEPAGPRPLEAP